MIPWDEFWPGMLQILVALGFMGVLALVIIFAAIALMGWWDSR